MPCLRLKIITVGIGLNSENLKLEFDLRPVWKDLRIIYNLQSNDSVQPLI